MSWSFSTSLRALILTTLVSSFLASTAFADPIRLDIDPSNPPRGDTTAVGWTPWALNVDLSGTNRAASHAFSGVTFTVAETDATIAQIKSTVPLLASEVVTQSAEAAYADVLANAGATKPARDFIDTRLISEVKNGTYTYVGSKDGLKGIIDTQDDVCDTVNGSKLCGYALVAAKTDKGTAPADSDHDGMPDAWETAHGLNPNNAADGNYDPDCDGFTNLDDYLAYMGGDVASVASKGAADCASASTAGTGGSSGTGAGGTLGGGVSGSGGAIGGNGAGGTAIGSGGAGGAGVVASTGGTFGSGGAAGVGAGGTAGQPANTGGSAAGGGSDGVTTGTASSGCSCELARHHDGGPGNAGLVGLAMAAAIVARRRRR